MAGGRIAGGLALGASTAGASLAALASWVTARRITAPGPREDKFVTPWELDIPYEEVAFPTEDGLLLRGWWLPASAAKRTVVALHGHRGARHHCVGIGAALCSLTTAGGVPPRETWCPWVTSRPWMLSLP